MDSDPVEIRGDIALRVADGYRGKPGRGRRDLCERHLPQADVATLRRDFDHRRIGPTPTV